MPCKPTADDCDRQTRILRPGSQRRGMIGGVGKEAVRQAFRPSGLGARIRRAVARRWGTNWTDVETRASSHQRENKKLQDFCASCLHCTQLVANQRELKRTLLSDASCDLVSSNGYNCTL
eukprot:7522915-Pyramimonas_sp.AAC.1